MQRGAYIIIVTAALSAISACANEGKLSIRASSTGYATGERPVPFRVAEARAHFALGNIALALEGFRKALRDDPASVDALNGIAVCYDWMGRFDLAGRYYEQALALAPGDSRLYSNLAVSLELQGRSKEAVGVRQELQARLAGRVEADLTAGSDAVKYDHSGPAVPIAEPSRPGASATVLLKPAETNRPATKVHLERTSLGELALVTTAKPLWKASSPGLKGRAMISSYTQTGRASRQMVLLNAARVAGLAARTRTSLRHIGWQRIAVGDAQAVRTKSIILYPAGGREQALRLSQDLHFGIGQRTSGGRELVVLLGRDAVGQARS